nr:hypothetical protein [Tanacetum cinerariifolium]
MLNPSPDAGIDSLFETTPQMNVPASTTMASLTLTSPTLTPPTIPTSFQVQQTPTPPTTASSNFLQDLPNFGSLFGFDHRLKTLEANFSEFVQTNQFAGVVSSILGIVQRYMDQRNYKGAVKEQVKVQVSKILPKIEKTVNEQLEAEVLTRSSNSLKTSYAVAADLLEMELKKILIEKMKSNKFIYRSDEQRNLYKALVEAYESDKIILDTYGDTVMLKRRRDDADKDEEPSAGSDPRSKRRREGKEPDESAPLKEPMQTNQDLEEPSHQEFKTGVADDQPIAKASQHPEWFQQLKKPPNSDRAWNKTLLATHGSIQPWISDLAKQPDSRSSFNELMDTPVDFSAFLMNRLKVDTLTPELLSGRLVIPFDHFINNDLEYLRGGASSCKYMTSVTKTKAADYRHIKWIENLVPHIMWIQVPNHRCHQTSDCRMAQLQSSQLDYGKPTNLIVEECFAFNVSLRMFTRSIVVQRHVEDLQLGVESYQKKINLIKPNTYRSDLKCKEAYTDYSNPRGFIYQNKDKHNRLMRIDELHKFSDGMLNDVRTALDDHLKAKDEEDHAKSGEVCWWEIVRGRLQDATIDHMIYQMLSLSYKGSTHGYLLVSVEVLRYDKRSKSENMGKVPTEMELILEHTQKGISDEVSVSAKGVEE